MDNCQGVHITTDRIAAGGVSHPCGEVPCRGAVQEREQLVPGEFPREPAWARQGWKRQGSPAALPVTRERAAQRAAKGLPAYETGTAAIRLWWP